MGAGGLPGDAFSVRTYLSPHLFGHVRPDVLNDACAHVAAEFHALLQRPLLDEAVEESSVEVVAAAGGVYAWHVEGGR